MFIYLPLTAAWVEGQGEGRVSLWQESSSYDLALTGFGTQGRGEEEPQRSREVEVSSLPMLDPKTWNSISVTCIEAVLGSRHTVRV